MEQKDVFSDPYHFHNLSTNYTEPATPRGVSRLFRLENTHAECLSSNQTCAFVYIHRYSTLGEIGNNRTPVQ